MPDLPDRRKREREIILALLLFWREQRKPITDWDGFERGVKTAVQPTLQRVYADAAGGIESPADPRKLTPKAEQYAADRAEELAKGVRKTVHEKTVLVEISGGDVESVFDERQAETIASTEVTGSISAGEAGAIEELAILTGVALRPRWFTEQDARVCEICGTLHGKCVEVYGRVSMTGPPAHPRCRCWLEYDRTF